MIISRLRAVVAGWRHLWHERRHPAPHRDPKRPRKQKFVDTHTDRIGGPGGGYGA